MNLRDYLKTGEKSVEALSEEVGVTPASLYRYAAGDRFPRPEVLERITKATDGTVTIADMARNAAEVTASRSAASEQDAA